jgi:hypothetical protein
MGLFDFLLRRRPARRAPARGRRRQLSGREYFEQQLRGYRGGGPYVDPDRVFTVNRARLAEVRQQRRRKTNPGPRLRLALDFLHGGQDHVRRNPSCPACDASRQFHGTDRFTRGGKVLVGDLESVVYRAPRGSSRQGLWEHQAGDRGIPFLRNRKRARLVADPKSGKLELDTRGSGVRWSPNKGIVG